MKYIVMIIKKLIFAFTVLYGFNIIMESLKIFIPLNLYTLGTVTFLGFPGLFLLVGLTLI